MICWKCKKEIDSADNYCKHCGAGQGDNVSFYYTLWGVWILYFFLGPFAIYFVVRSPVIEKKLKWIISIIMLVVFVLFTYKFVAALKQVADIYTSLLDTTIYLN